MLTWMAAILLQASPSPARREPCTGAHDAVQICAVAGPTTEVKGGRIGLTLRLTNATAYPEYVIDYARVAREHPRFVFLAGGGASLEDRLPGPFDPPLRLDSSWFVRLGANETIDIVLSLAPASECASKCYLVLPLTWPCSAGCEQVGPLEHPGSVTWGSVGPLSRR